MSDRISLKNASELTSLIKSDLRKNKSDELLEEWIWSGKLICFGRPVEPKRTDDEFTTEVEVGETVEIPRPILRKLEPQGPRQKKERAKYIDLDFNNNALKPLGSFFIEFEIEIDGLADCLEISAEQIENFVSEKRGRKPNYDWDSYLITLIKRANRNKIRTRDEVERDMEVWFQIQRDNNEPSTLSQIEMVNKICKHLAIDWEPETD